VNLASLFSHKDQRYLILLETVLQIFKCTDSCVVNG